MAQKDPAMINPHPNPWFRWNCSVCWVTLGLVLLTILSFLTLDLQLERLFSVDSAKRMGRFLGELLSPDVRAVFLHKLWIASIETLAMSAVGTILAAFFWLTAGNPGQQKSPWRSCALAFCVPTHTQWPSLHTRTRMGSLGSDIGWFRTICRHTRIGTAHDGCTWPLIFGVD